MNSLKFHIEKLTTDKNCTPKYTKFEINYLLSTANTLFDR